LLVSFTVVRVEVDILSTHPCCLTVVTSLHREYIRGNPHWCKGY